MDFQNPSKRPEIWLQESLCHPVLKVTTSGQIAAVSGRFSLHPPKRHFGGPGTSKITTQLSDPET